MYCIHLSFIFISWLVGWLMYLLGECCASCSSMIHDPPSIYLLSFLPWSFLNHSLKTGGPLMSTWFFSNLTYPQISSPFLFLLLVLSAYRICLFSHLSLLFFVSFGLVTHVVLAFFHFRHFSFLFHLDLSLVVHAFMRRYFSVRSRVFHSFDASMRRYFFVRICFWWLLITDWLLMTWLHDSLMTVINWTMWLIWYTCWLTDYRYTDLRYYGRQECKM